MSGNAVGQRGREPHSARRAATRGSTRGIDVDGSSGGGPCERRLSVGDPSAQQRYEVGNRPNPARRPGRRAVHRWCRSGLANVPPRPRERPGRRRSRRDSRLAGPGRGSTDTSAGGSWPGRRGVVGRGSTARSSAIRCGGGHRRTTPHRAPGKPYRTIPNTLRPLPLATGGRVTVRGRPGQGLAGDRRENPDGTTHAASRI